MLIYNILYNRELNYLRLNYRFEKIALFHCMNFRSNLPYDSREAWYTLYAMLPLNHKRDDDIDLLP